MCNILSQGVGSLEIRHLERVTVHELPDSGVVWTKEVQALRGEKELRSSSFYDKSSILERMDTPETKQLVTSLSAATTSGGTTTICMWKRSSTNQPKSGRAYCRVLWVRKGHTANQASGESSQQSGRGYSSAGICEENVRTITHRVEDTAESSITVEQKIGKCEECSAERTMESGGSESCGYSGPDCQRTGGPRSSENSSRTLKARTRSSQSSYRSRRRTPTRPLLGHHRQHHFRITQSWSACRAPGAGTTGSRTLINGLQGLCAAAGAVTVADEPEDPMMDFDGSDEEFQQMLSKASQDEEIAMSVRGRLTYKRSQTGKEISQSQALEISCSHHTQRRASNPHRKTRSRYVDVKSHNQKNYHAVTSTESTQTALSTKSTET